MWFKIENNIEYYQNNLQANKFEDWGSLQFKTSQFAF
jgi:hypothetical protein